jgi:hypothetical protein
VRRVREIVATVTLTLAMPIQSGSIDFSRRDRVRQLIVRVGPADLINLNRLDNFPTGSGS